MPQSKIFFFCLVSFIAGIGVASYVFISDTFLSVLFIVGVVVFASLFKKHPAFFVGLYVICFAVGILRYQASVVSFSFAPPHTEVIFEGSIAERPSARLSNTQLVLSQVVFENKSISFPHDVNILLFASHYPRYQYGDRIAVRSRLRAPEKIEDFDYPAYLSRKNIYLTGFPSDITLIDSGHGIALKRFLFSMRGRFEYAIQRTISEPHGAFLNGLLLGETGQMPRDITDQFRATGLSHIVALSGYNITIIANFFLLVLLWIGLSRAKSFWFVVAGICSFVILTGAEASVVRAAVMGILVLIAYQAGRMYSIRNALALAAAIMLAMNPKLLSFDISFQLSFLATLGLVYLAPRLEPLLKRIPERFSLREYLSATVSAQFAVLPLLLREFETFSLIAPLANIAVLPVIPLAMLVGFIVSVAGAFAPFISGFLNVLVWPFLAWPLMIAKLLNSVPFASFHLGFGIGAMIVYIIIVWRWLKLPPKEYAP